MADRLGDAVLVKHRRSELVGSALADGITPFKKMLPKAKSTSNDTGKDVKPPMILDYGRTERFGGLGREIHATAYAIGGWIQVAIAVGLCLLGMMLGLLTTDSALSYLSLFLGMGGFIVGLLIPVPSNSDDWRRLAMAVSGGVVGIMVGWWIFPPGLKWVGLCGYRLGLALYDEESR